MLNLEQQAVIEWLAELRPSPTQDLWPPAVRPVETAKPISEALEELGKLLENIRQRNARSLAAALQADPIRSDLQTVLAQMGAARPLRILHWLAESGFPDCHAIAVALTAGDSIEAHALRATIAAVTRRATLSRIFAPDRVAALQSAVETTLKDTH